MLVKDIAYGELFLDTKTRINKGNVPVLGFIFHVHESNVSGLIFFSVTASIGGTLRSLSLIVLNYLQQK